MFFAYDHEPKDKDKKTEIMTCLLKADILL